MIDGESRLPELVDRIVNKRLIIALFALAAISPCRAEKGVDRKNSSGHLQMANYCVGRTVVAIPVAFKPVPIWTGSFKEAGARREDEPVEVLVQSLKPGGFQPEVASRRAELLEGGNDKLNVLKLEKALSENTVLFRVQEIDDAYISELLFVRGDSLVRARIDSFHNQFREAEARLEEFAKLVLPIAELSGVDSSGFCVGHVVVAGTFMRESGGSDFLNGQGARFSVEVDTYVRNSKDTLLSRVSSPRSLLKIFDVPHRVLRARELKIAGMRAQEWLGSAKVGEEQYSLGFSLETMREVPGPLKPSIQVELNTAEALEDGTQTTTTFSDAEALGIWDAVVRSIRPNTSQ